MISSRAAVNGTPNARIANAMTRTRCASTSTRIGGACCPDGKADQLLTQINADLWIHAGQMKSEESVCIPGICVHLRERLMLVLKFTGYKREQVRGSRSKSHRMLLRFLPARDLLHTLRDSLLVAQ